MFYLFEITFINMIRLHLPTDICCITRGFEKPPVNDINEIIYVNNPNHGLCLKINILIIGNISTIIEQTYSIYDIYAWISLTLTKLYLRKTPFLATRIYNFFLQYYTLSDWSKLYCSTYMYNSISYHAVTRYYC